MASKHLPRLKMVFIWSPHTFPIDYGIFTKGENHRNQPKVGKYTIHGMVWMLTETLITVTLKKGSAIKIHNEGAAQNVFIRFCLPGDSIRDHFDPRLLEVTIRSRELTVLKRSPASSAELPGSQTFCGNGLFQIGRMNQTCTLLVYHTLSQNCQDRWKYDTFFQ